MIFIATKEMVSFDVLFISLNCILSANLVSFHVFTSFLFFSFFFVRLQFLAGLKTRDSILLLLVFHAGLRFSPVFKSFKVIVF